VPSRGHSHLITGGPDDRGGWESTACFKLLMRYSDYFGPICQGGGELREGVPKATLG
jgi:hypothetical protein